MNTESNKTKTKLEKAQASVSQSRAKFIAARDAYNAAYSAWVSRKDYGSASYDMAFRDLHPLRVEMNKWSGQYSKSLGRIYV
jgi:hypothetical protein